jgi:uncharacterized protein YqgV (UPF0045/DUF77 family)
MTTNRPAEAHNESDGSMVHAEFLIEPFVEGTLGPHVSAALDACREHGLEPDVGPFASTVRGPVEVVTAATQALTQRALAAGATGVQVRFGASPVTAQFGSLHGALERMVSGVEEQFGVPLAEMSREQKQVAVRLLNEQGAFLLRKAVESVGELMGVSRITIYNYLNAIQSDG